LRKLVGGTVCDAGFDAADGVEVGVEEVGGLLVVAGFEQVEDLQVLAGLDDQPGTVGLMVVLDQTAHPVDPGHRISQIGVAEQATIISWNSAP
jgi:hypothetical protein